MFIETLKKREHSRNKKVVRLSEVLSLLEVNESKNKSTESTRIIGADEKELTTIVPDTVPEKQNQQELTTIVPDTVPDTQNQQNTYNNTVEDFNNHNDDETRLETDETNANSLTHVTNDSHTKQSIFASTAINYSAYETTMFSNVGSPHITAQNLDNQDLPSDSFIQVQLSKVNLKDSSLLENYETVELKSNVKFFF